MIKFKDINNSTHLGVASISRKHSVNGEKSLSGTIYSGDDVLNNLDTGWGLEFDGEPYVITYFEHHDSDNTISFDAIHKFFWDFSKKMFYRKFNGSNTIDTYLGNIFDGTGYKYALNFKPNAISKENFGMTSKMSMFNDIITAIGAEFEVNGTLVSIYQKIGTDLSTIVRHGFNLSDMAIQNDISGFSTYAEGFGVHTNPDDENSPRLHVVYESPLAKTYGRIEAEPIDDERYTVQDNLLAALKAKVDNTLPVSISLSLYDLNKSGYPYKMAKVGDWITAVDEKINFKQKIRIISVDDEFSADGTRISYAVTAGNISSVQRYQEANASISSRINNAINSADQANQAALSAQVTADGKNTTYRGNSVDELPTNANEGDQGWVQSGDGLVLYIYTKRPDGSFFWDKRIDPEMGQQIAEGVNNAVNQAKTYTDGVKSKVESDIKQASQNANDALTTANKANTDLINTANDLTNKLNDKASVSYVDTANGQLNAQLVTQGKSIAAINLNSNKLSASLVNTQGDVSKLSQTANTLTAGLNDAKGNIATLQGRANSFDLTVAKVNNLSYENRNLLLDSGFESGKAHGLGTLYDSTEATASHYPQPSGKYAVVMSDNKTMPEQVWFWILDNPITIKAGQRFTISYDYAVAGDAPRASDYWFDEKGNPHEMMAHTVHDMSNQMSWKRVSFSQTLPTDITISKLRFGFQHDKPSIGWKTVDNIKIELGATATPHSYAPEDTASALASIQVKTDSITNFVKDASGNLSSEFISALLKTSLMKGVDGGSSLMSQTANSFNQAIQDNNKKVISFINLDNSGAQIKGKLLTLDGDTNVTGDFYAKGGNFKNLNASNFTTGTLDASKVRVANIDAGNITAGAINGVSLKIDLTTGSVNFARGRIKSNSENVDINIDEGYISVKNYAARATLRDGGLYLTQPNIFDTSNNPYFSLTNNGSGLTYQGAQLKGSQYIVVTTNDNSSNIFDVNLGQETFVGIAGGRDGDDWKPTKIGGASRGVIISGGKEYGGIMTSSPSIIVGSSSSQGTGSAYSGTRITLNGEYVQIPSAYNQTNSTPANLAVTYTGALVRTTSASKYKTSIHRSDSSHLGDKLLNVPMATWFDKATIRRFKEENEEQRPRVEFGMIAEDLADAGLDWLVVRDPTGEIEGIKYDRLAVALIPVIKNLKQEIEELKNERISN